jgi:ComF family protein
MLSLKQWSLDLIGLLFPNLCNACGVTLFEQENLICTKCLYDLPFTDYHLHAEIRVAKQLWGRLPLHGAMAMLYFRKATKVQNLVHHLKYKGKTELGVVLGELLGNRLKTGTNYSDIDLIIPVPLHQQKFRKRGYNQSSYIAEGVSSAMAIPSCEDTLIRCVATDSQTKKSRYTRYENMKSVFKVSNASNIINKHVLLIDDVITTGATLEACANELLEQGAAKVSIAALAFAE